MTARTHGWIVLGAAALGLASCQTEGRAPETPTGEFANLILDLGVVVGDLEKSARFYTEAIGFKEIKGFDVPASMGSDAGLTDNRPFRVRVFVLGEGPSATRLKLMEFPDVPATKPDNAFIHSALGYRYLTIHVNDTAAALKRLERAGLQPLARGPVLLPKGFPEGIYLTCVKDPDGNLVELVGPMRQGPPRPGCEPRP